MPVLESRVVKEEAGWEYCGPGLHSSPRFEQHCGKWTVAITHEPWPVNTYAVAAVREPSGAVLKATHAETGEERLFRSLGAARKAAGRLATALRGTMAAYIWMQEE